MSVFLLKRLENYQVLICMMVDVKDIQGFSSPRDLNTLNFKAKRHVSGNIQTLVLDVSNKEIQSSFTSHCSIPSENVISFVFQGCGALEYSFVDWFGPLFLSTISGSFSDLTLVDSVVINNRYYTVKFLIVSIFMETEVSLMDGILCINPEHVSYYSAQQMMQLSKFIIVQLIVYATSFKTFH